MDMLKKLLSSKLWQLLFSAVLIYFAFQKVDIVKLLREISVVPLWKVIIILIYLFLLNSLSGIRWSLLLLSKPGAGDYWHFIKATYLGAFYTIFFPTALAGDALKWLPLVKKYPEISKVKLASSVLMDRAIGLFGFVFVGGLSLLVGKLLGYSFPSVLSILFSGLMLGLMLFVLILFKVDYEAILSKFELTKKFIITMDILKKAEKNVLWKTFLISLLIEPVWMIPFWFYSKMFNAGIPLVELFIFLPIIGLILLLPISLAGFGARENLFLYFLAPLGYDPEKLLLVSTFAGIITVLNSLVGGLFGLINYDRKIVAKN